jgi:dTDP-4-dehydrorhamnose reductase
LNKVLVTGASGLFGLNFIHHLIKAQIFDVHALIHSRPLPIDNVKTYYIVDEGISSIMHSIKPDIVVHAAGLTNVEQCESDKDLAIKSNVEFSSQLGELCTEINSKILYISTDHLWSDQTQMRDETVPLNPINNYGLTKGYGEKAIAKTCQKHFILRTNFFGWGPKYRQSFSDYIINSLKSKNRIKLYKDVFYTPIEISLLSKLILRLFSSEAYGIYNATGSSRISKFDFGKLLASAFNLPRQLIEPVFYNNMNYEVPRPHEMSLSNQKICEAVGIEKNSLSIEASISRLLLDYQEDFIQDIRQL